MSARRKRRPPDKRKGRPLDRSAPHQFSGGQLGSIADLIWQAPQSIPPIIERHWWRGEAANG